MKVRLRIQNIHGLYLRQQKGENEIDPFGPFFDAPSACSTEQLMSGPHGASREEQLLNYSKLLQISIRLDCSLDLIQKSEQKVFVALHLFSGKFKPWVGADLKNQKQLKHVNHGRRQGLTTRERK